MAENFVGDRSIKNNGKEGEGIKVSNKNNQVHPFKWGCAWLLILTKLEAEIRNECSNIFSFRVQFMTRTGDKDPLIWILSQESFPSPSIAYFVWCLVLHYIHTAPNLCDTQELIFYKTQAVQVL
ncbi:MAG: hypothetical protein K0Q56_1677 [Sporolactobacillus laevolacticus]|nr:hypothetical protein [Sporolactobacillus laevolacticus]